MTPRVRATAVRPALAAALVLALAMLTACDPGAPAGPTPSTTATPSASPSADPQPGSKPASRFDLGCADLATEATLTAVHTAPVAAADPLGSTLSLNDGIPTPAVVQQLGGVACAWTNGAPLVIDHMVSDEFSGTTVYVIADTAAQWTTFTDTYGAGDSHLNCYSTGTVVNCDLNEFAAGTWIEVTTYGVNADPSSSAADFAASITPLLDEVRAAVGSAEISAASVEEAPVPIPSECDAVISGEQFGAALGVGPTVSGGPHGGWSLGAAARALAAAETCIFFYPDTDLATGVLRWLPSGAWAAQASMAMATVPSPPTDAGLDGADASWVRCAPANGECIVDATIHGHWLQVTVSADDTMGYPAPADRRVAAFAVMETVIATIGG